MNEAMLMKVETFKKAATKTFNDATDFIFTSKELLEIQVDNPGLVIPGVIWKSSINASTSRILPKSEKSRKLFDLNKSIDLCNDNSLNKTASVTAPVLQPTPKLEAVKPQVVIGAKVLSLTKLVENDIFDEALYIPAVSDKYIPWGIISKINTIIKSRKFFPILVTGNKGYGKTFMIEQACAKFKRPLIRMNFTSETDESKLIGHMNLIDGNTVWTDGMVLKAMKMGAVLLLDEVDLAGEKIMCLQSIMEGGSYINKKNGEVVAPAEGFTIIATSNTKGHGNVDGRYVGAKKMNIAFLDRIKLTFCLGAPTQTVEKKILTKMAHSWCSELSLLDADYAIIDSLTFWAESIRKAFNADSIEDDISTRRLAFILETYFLFNRDIEFAIEGALNTYDEDDVTAIMSLWRASHGIDRDTGNAIKQHQPPIELHPNP